MLDGTEHSALFETNNAETLQLARTSIQTLNLTSPFVCHRSLSGFWTFNLRNSCHLDEHALLHLSDALKLGDVDRREIHEV
jgi:hypothetical protein